MSNPLLANLDGLDGPALKARFAEARKSAVAAGAMVEADAATRALQQSMRNAIRAMVKGIDARAAAPRTAAAAGVPAPRPPAPVRPLAPPRLPGPAQAAAPTPKPAAPKPRWTPPPPPVPPPIDPDDDNIPF